MPERLDYEATIERLVRERDDEAVLARGRGAELATRTAERDALRAAARAVLADAFDFKAKAALRAALGSAAPPTPDEPDYAMEAVLILRAWHLAEHDPPWETCELHRCVHARAIENAMLGAAPSTGETTDVRD